MAKQSYGTTSVATQRRKWAIRGHYPNGSKLRFSVLAYDHAEAVKKAETRKGGGVIDDVVLVEPGHKWL